MQEIKKKNNSLQKLSKFRSESGDILSRIKSLFWEWNSTLDTITIYSNDFDINLNLLNDSSFNKNDFVNLFDDESRSELLKIFSEYNLEKRKSHRILCNLIPPNEKSFKVLNLGYSSYFNSNIKVTGILAKVDTEIESSNNIEEIKEILKQISSYTEEEFWIRDLNFRYIFFSRSQSDIYGYSSDELLKTPLEKIFTPESIYYIQHIIEEELKFSHSSKTLSDKNFVFTLKGFRKDGKQVWTENNLNFIKDANDIIIGMWGMTRDVTKKIKTDQVREALYKISEYSHITEDLNDFFAEIHSIIKAIMPANNFNICLFDKENNYISCPYQVDEKQQKIMPHKFGKGLIEYLIKSGKGLFLDSNYIKKLIIEQKIEPLMIIPLNYIGIPLIIKNEIMGVIIAQSYNELDRFCEEDFENLKFVADQTSMVIERKINETEKIKIKKLLEAVSKAQSILLTKRDVYVGIQLALEQIGNIINLNRISLYENVADISGNSIQAKLLIEWTSQIEFQSGSFQKFDYYPNLKRWLDEFSLGNSIKDKMKSLPLAEYEILKNSKAKSILCIPIFLTKKLWGFIKFDDCKNERLWNEQEISVLSLVAASIGGMFQRKIAEDTLRTSEEKYRNFVNNSLEGISLLQFKEPIDILLPIEQQIDLIYEHGYIADANDSLAKMYGLNSARDIIGKTLLEIHGESDVETNRRAFKEFIFNGYKIKNVETIEKKIDGTEIILLNNSLGILNNNKLNAIWGSQIDITARKMFEAELKQAKDKAEEVNRIKTYFLANMSHELRTPLIGILGYAEILNEDLKENQFKEMASIIFQSGTKLLETLNSILTISKIESENFSVIYKNFDLKELLKEIVGVFQPIAQKKGIHLLIESSDEHIIINSDIKIVREILNNLINNALKFTETGSVIIQTTINSDLNKLFLSVKDTGIGIQEEKLDLIFHEFRQASEGFSRNFEGVGLGLAICKKYVHILKGNISVKSKLNQGSTFIVELPLNIFD